MVAWLEHRDGGTDLINDTDAFMTQNAPGFAARKVALEDVKIGAAYGGFGNLDDRVGRRGNLGLGAPFQRLLANGLIDESLHHGRAGGCGSGRGRLFYCCKSHGWSPFWQVDAKCRDRLIGAIAMKRYPAGTHVSCWLVRP